MKEYKAYIFDMDLTLLDTTHSAYLAYLEAFKAIGVDHISKECVPHHLSIPLKDSYDEVENPTNSYQVFKDTFQNVSLNNIFSSSQIYPDAIRYIKKLHNKNKILGIVTNRDYYTIETILKNNQIFEYFSSIITCEKVTNLKPSKEPMDICLSQLKVNQNEAIYLGDAQNDYLCSKNAGVDFIAIERYHNCNFDCERKVNSMDELD